MGRLSNISEKVSRGSKHEGITTKGIESVTSSVPSSTWLALAGGSVIASLVLKVMGRHSTANFVGEWVPSLLVIGLYNKMVKVMGSERRAFA
jgi:hypothetical protein